MVKCIRFQLLEPRILLDAAGIVTAAETTVEQKQDSPYQQLPTTLPSTEEGDSNTAAGAYQLDQSSYDGSTLNAVEATALVVVDHTDVKFVAYLPEHQLARVEEGMTAKFFADSPEYGVHEMIISKIEFHGSPSFRNLYLASTFGGSVGVRETERGDLIPVQSQYRVELKPIEESLKSMQVARGVVVIDGHAESLFNRIRKRFVSVFIRETGF